MVLSELRENYWGAAVAYRLFEKAQADLHESPQAQWTESEATSHSKSENHENKSTRGIVLTPGSSLSEVSDPGLRDTTLLHLNDSLPDPVDFFSDDFAASLMSNIDDFARSDAASILGPILGDDFKLDSGIDPSKLEFTNSKQAGLT